jgi:GTP cyclohydrolase II
METLQCGLQVRLQSQQARSFTPELNSEIFSSRMIIRQIADVRLPTHWAEFRLLGFEALCVNQTTGQERLESALALVLGDVHGVPPIVRIHSQCITGEALHSLRCDCHDQLHMALRTISDEGAGLLIYEQQEGRGIGLMEKLRAYQLQDQGLDTVEANLRLGHAADSRDYQLAVQVLHCLGIQSLRLMSNNPDKVRAVLASGIGVVERIGADVPANEHSTTYLNTKREKMGHLIAPQKAIFTVEDQTACRRPIRNIRNHAAVSGRDAGADLRGASW